MLYCLLLCGVKPNASKLPGAEERDLSSIVLSCRAKIIEKNSCVACSGPLLIKVAMQSLFRKILFGFACLDSGQCEHSKKETHENNNISKGPKVTGAKHTC